MILETSQEFLFFLTAIAVAVAMQNNNDPMNIVIIVVIGCDRDNRRMATKRYFMSLS
jgi:hypothetical protein